MGEGSQVSGSWVLGGGEDGWLLTVGLCRQLHAPFM